MLRQVVPRDNIAVSLDAATLDRVFGFRHGGIASETLAKQPFKSFEEPVPNRIWRRGEVFCVQVRGRCRRARTLEDAVQLATDATPVMGDGEPSDDDRNIEGAAPMAITDVSTC
jgi:hypothetical protein